MELLLFTFVGIAGLAALIPLARANYIRRYMAKRLYFQPWVNLSKNTTLDVGDAVAEILFFELEGIKALLEKAKSKQSELWNEKAVVASADRSFDAFPALVRATNDDGVRSAIERLMRLVLFVPSQVVRGTIQQYGSSARFQLALEGLQGPQTKLTTPCWAVDIPTDAPERIPEAVRELAHSVVLDSGDVHGFKTARSFRHFTAGLRQHLAYNDFRRPSFLEEAEECYRAAIDHEGGNAEASCNLGDLLYSQFTYELNEEAIQAYKGALRTEEPALRARAFRGLANAFCQRRQRHNRGGDAALQEALRWARFASKLCKETSNLPPKDRASIKKAEAYAQQVWAELGDFVDNDCQRRAFQVAIDLYKAAIDLNARLTVAYNNVSYLYLKRAEAIIRPFSDQVAMTEEMVSEAGDYLRRAEEWCTYAIDTERTFHMAYDNKGNISLARAALDIDSFESHAGIAVESYHEALSYQPVYKEAYNDLSVAHCRLFKICDLESRVAERERRSNNEANYDRKQKHHGNLAWQHHWDALKCTQDTESKRFICDRFAVIRSQTYVPDPGIVADDDCHTAVKAGCVCEGREVII